MFGNAEWFQQQQGRQRLRPASWKGWLYSAAWPAAMGVPAVMLLGAEKAPEALVWLAASGGLFVWDWRQLRQAKGATSPASDVLYIGDDETSPPVATRRYCFFARK